MLEHFYKYLLLHRQAGVPGVGNFAIETTPAFLDGNTVHPPQQFISFKPGSALTDKQFYQYVAAETGMTEVDSVRQFQDFAYQLRKDLQTHSQVALQGLGVLKKTSTAEIAFEPLNALHQFLSPVTLREVQRENNSVDEDESIHPHGIEVYDEPDTIKKDYWWIWAVLLAVTALAIIGYFYLQGEII